jgi:hypothetical protein
MVRKLFMKGACPPRLPGAGPDSELLSSNQSYITALKEIENGH